jgi:hypothetical protein
MAARMSKVWRLFGGQAIREIILPGEHFGLRDTKVIADWFPEAQVRYRVIGKEEIEVQ